MQYSKSSSQKELLCRTLALIRIIKQHFVALQQRMGRLFCRLNSLCPSQLRVPVAENSTAQDCLTIVYCTRLTKIASVALLSFVDAQQQLASKAAEDRNQDAPIIYCCLPMGYEARFLERSFETPATTEALHSLHVDLCLRLPC